MRVIAFYAKGVIPRSGSDEGSGRGIASSRAPAPRSLLVASLVVGMTAMTLRRTSNLYQPPLSAGRLEVVVVARWPSSRERSNNPRRTRAAGIKLGSGRDTHAAPRAESATTSREERADQHAFADGDPSSTGGDGDSTVRHQLPKTRTKTHGSTAETATPPENGAVYFLAAGFFALAFAFGATFFAAAFFGATFFAATFFGAAFLATAFFGAAFFAAAFFGAALVAAAFFGAAFLVAGAFFTGMFLSFHSLPRGLTIVSRALLLQPDESRSLLARRIMDVIPWSLVVMFRARASALVARSHCDWLLVREAGALVVRVRPPIRASRRSRSTPSRCLSQQRF
jgi:hypothetical protein